MKFRTATIPTVRAWRRAATTADKVEATRLALDLIAKLCRIYHAREPKLRIDYRPTASTRFEEGRSHLATGTIWIADRHLRDSMPVLAAIADATLRPNPFRWAAKLAARTM